MLVRTNLLPQDIDALTIWPFIFVRPDDAVDAPLIEHEMVHYREQRAAWVLPWLLRYVFSRDFRFAAELRGYRRQIELGGITAEKAALLLSSKYRLSVNYTAAFAALSEGA